MVHTQHGRQLGMAWIRARKFEVVPVAGAGIHLHLPIGPNPGRQRKAKLAGGIGVPELNGPSAAGGNQPHRSILGRQAAGETGFQLHLGLGGGPLSKGRSQGAQLFQGALDAMGLGGLGPNANNTGREDRNNGRQSTGHGGSQLDFQRLWLPFPACTMRAIELTIMDRASLASLRPCSSEANTRSAAVRGRGPAWDDR